MVHKKRKRDREPVGVLYIPIGIFIGLGIGIYLGKEFILPFVCGGLAVGLFFILQSQKREYRRWMKEEKAKEVFEQYHAPLEIEQARTPHVELNSYLVSTLQAYVEKLEQLRKIVAHLPNEKRRLVSDILLLLEKVYEYVEKDPSRYPMVKVFFQTYILSTETILEKYDMLLNQPVKNEEAIQAIRKIEGMLVEMKKEFEGAYVRLYEEDISQVHVETELLRNTFKEEKLIKWP